MDRVVGGRWETDFEKRDTLYQAGKRPSLTRVDKSVQPTKSEELRSFLLLTVVMAPVLTGMIIAGYGFLVWMMQIIAGPPTGG